MKFDYYALNTYVPEADGEGPELYAKLVEQVVAAEQLGFECAWFTEHHFGRFGGMIPSPQILIAAIAQRTTRIRLGTAVVLLSMHHPLLVAEEMAMLDILSNGRLNVGFGRGMATQPYRVFGTEPTDAQSKLEEQVEIVLGAWTTSPFSWKGEHYQFPDPVTPRPQTLQRPHPPLWMPASSDVSHSRWIGRHGINLMTLPWLQGFEVTRKVIAEYRIGLTEGGFDPGQCEVLSYLPTYVGATSEQARIESDRYWDGFSDVAAEERSQPSSGNPYPTSQLVGQSRLIFGDAAEVRGHIQRIIDEIGVDRLALMFHFGGMPQELALASTRRFAEEVAPYFKG